MHIDTVILDTLRTLKKCVAALNELDEQTILIWLGAWVATTEYKPGNVVSNGGFKWLSLSTNTNITPVEGANWTLL